MTGDSSSAHQRRIAFLDFLRIFAFASVFIGHNFYLPLTKAAISPELHASVRMMASALMPLTHGGGAGVVVFFLISGYIITYVLRSETASEFAVRRLFRIYPLYVLAVTVQTIGAATLGREVDFGVFLAQISLLGDVFGVDYALGGVEWTLRIELAFYVYMAALKACGVLDRRFGWLPYIHLGAGAVAMWLAPIPADTTAWATGYTTIYAPLLLMGSIIYVIETGAIRRDVGALVLAAQLAAHYTMIPLYQKAWMESHFALLAVALFLGLWVIRARIGSLGYVRQISDLTYSVYLFHAWAYHRIHDGIASLPALAAWATPLALLGFFVLCAVALRVVEKPLIAVGKRLSTARS